MPANRVSVDLPVAEQQEVMGAIATIHQKLSFLIPMSSEERRSNRGNRLTVYPVS